MRASSARLVSVEIFVQKLQCSFVWKSHFLVNFSKLKGKQIKIEKVRRVRKIKEDMASWKCFLFWGFIAVGSEVCSLDYTYTSYKAWRRLALDILQMLFYSTHGSSKKNPQNIKKYVPVTKKKKIFRKIRLYFQMKSWPPVIFPEWSYQAP